MRDALSVGGLKPPRPKDYRVLVATDAARELNDAELQRVTRHLCHSMTIRTPNIVWEKNEIPLG